MKKICKIPNCSREEVALDMCGTHYARWNRGLRGEELEAPIRKHPLSLDKEDAEEIWRLLYNICSLGHFPTELDQPNDPSHVMDRFDEIRLELEEKLGMDKE